ncbi:MAG: tetratricopeptide repeat protein [Solirubrobacterales bacterium]
MIEEWEKLTNRKAPAGLRAFAEDPDSALDDLLGEVGDFDVVARGPAGAIGNWLLPLDTGSALTKTIDESVKSRIESEWLPTEGGGPQNRRRALLLMDLFDVIASAPGKMPKSTAVLMDRFPQHERVLAPWSPAPSQDPLGRFLLAVARNQSDRHLSPHWFRLCRLPASLPLFRAEYAIAGLRGLPPQEDPAADEFPYEVASGLRLLADGIRIAVEGERVDPEEGRKTILALTQVSIAAYPLAGWEEALLENVDHEAPLTAEYLREMARLDQRALPQQVLRKLFDKQSPVLRQPPAAPPQHKQKRRIPFSRLLRDLEKGKHEAPEQMQHFLDEEITKIERKGDLGENLGKFLRQASTAARSRFPREAVWWSQEALRWDPSDVRSWTSATAALRRSGKLEQAVDIAWRAQARFPFKHGIWVEVALALEEQKRLETAAIVFEEAIYRFPDDAPPRSAYAELLLKTNRADEAVVLLKPMVEFYAEADEIPKNAVNLWGSLTAALISSGNVDEAREVATDASRLLPYSYWAQRMPEGFDEFCRRRRELDAAIRAQSPLQEEASWSQTLFSMHSEARLMRQSARRLSKESAEAGHLLESNREKGRTDPLFLAELMEFLVDRGRPQEALGELQRTPFAESVDPSISLAATRAKRAQLTDAGSGSERRYSPKALASLTSHIQAATATIPALRPVALVSSLQGTAAMFDGAVLDGERTSLYGQLQAWLQRVTTRSAQRTDKPAEELDFEEHWAAALESLLGELGDQPTGGELAATAEEREAELDELDEDFVRRIAVLA